MQSGVQSLAWLGGFSANTLGVAPVKTFSWWYYWLYKDLRGRRGNFGQDGAEGWERSWTVM